MLNRFGFKKPIFLKFENENFVISLFKTKVPNTKFRNGLGAQVSLGCHA